MHRRLSPKLAPRLAAVLVGAAVSLPALAALQEGRYSIVSTVKTGSGDPRSQTREECLTAQEAQHPGPALLEEVTNNGSCQVSNSREAGDRFTADFTCSVQGRSARGHMDVSFLGGAMNGTITSQVSDQQAGARTINTTIAATRVGACQ